MFGDKLPSSILGFQSHQCPDTAFCWSQESSHSTKESSQVGQGLHAACQGGQQSLRTPTQGHSAGESRLACAGWAADPPPAALQTVLTGRLFCSGLGEEPQKILLVFGNSPQPSLGNAKPYLSVRPSLSVNALVYRGKKVQLLRLVLELPLIHL